MKVDYEKKIRIRQEENVKKVRENISSPEMQKKIINFSSKYNLNKRYVEQKIIDDYSFRVQFAIDPSRQSYHEDIAYDYLKDLEIANKCIRLPASGGNAKYVTENGIVNGSLGKKISNSKSIDFEFEIDNVKIYISHKYTKDDGGAQDNQFNDIKLFINDVNLMLNNNISNKYENKIFIALVDGPYYKRGNRLEELRSLGGNNVEVLSIEGMEKMLKSIRDK